MRHREKSGMTRLLFLPMRELLHGDNIQGWNTGIGWLEEENEFGLKLSYLELHCPL